MIKLGSNTNDIAPDLSLQEDEEEKDKRNGVIRRR